MTKPNSLFYTRYYDEFLAYFHAAKDQQERSNLGNEPHETSGFDDLTKHVQLYDVVERKFAGFSQLVNDCFYGRSDDHPYIHKIEDLTATEQRMRWSAAWDGKRSVFGVAEWFYLFMVHRLTGSAINYGTKPSGYHNTVTLALAPSETIDDMVETIKTYDGKMYTSIGYQFPAFPKPPSGSGYRRGGDYFMCEMLPDIVRDLATEITGSDSPWTLREVGEWLIDRNRSLGLRAYRFQYAAFVADVADWFPELVVRESHFYYGSNAVECIGYLAERGGKPVKKIDLLDEVMSQAAHDTGGVPYNLEDVACDFIRWIENYSRPGADYEHLDLDNVWNCSGIVDHPRGRQRKMLELGLIESFNDLGFHPSDTKVLDASGLSVDEYRDMVRSSI
mgnify:CR=1 FL=1